MRRESRGQERKCIRYLRRYLASKGGKISFKFISSQNLTQFLNHSRHCEVSREQLLQSELVRQALAKMQASR